MCVAVIAGQLEANVGAGTWSVQHHSSHPGQFTTGSHPYWVLSRYIRDKQSSEFLSILSTTVLSDAAPQ